MDALMHRGGEDRKQMISGSGTKRIKQGDVTGSELDGGKVWPLHRGGVIPPSEQLPELQGLPAH